MKDKDNEGCWVIAPPDGNNDHETIDNSLSSVIGNAIEEYGGNCYIDDIYSYVEEVINIFFLIIFLNFLELEC